MKRLLLTCVTASALIPGLATAADSEFRNEIFGNITVAPQISATNFINFGTFNIFTFPYPFETFETLNYTNFGIMICDNGWRFETSPAVSGPRRMASSFVNYNGGVVQAVDPLATALQLPCFPALYDPSYLIISATNIITGAGAPSGGASLVSGAHGLLQLAGSDVDLSNSGLMITPVYDEANSSLITVDHTQFQPDVAVADLYWVITNFTMDYVLPSGGLWNGFFASSLGIPMPPSQPIPAPGFTLAVPYADSYVVEVNPFTLVVTNFEGDISNVTAVITTPLALASNLFKGAVFASGPGQIASGFQPSAQARNFFEDTSVVLSVGVSNAVTSSPGMAYVRVFDTLASDTRYRALSTNIVGCPFPSTFRTMNYIFDRVGQVIGGSGNNGYPDPNFYTASGFGLRYPANIISDGVTNTVLENGVYSGYGAYYDNVIGRPVPVLGGNETNFSGRVTILADNLNLENTRIRAEGRIYVEAAHLVSSSNAILDCENISFSLASTNGVLDLHDITSAAAVQRLRGPVLAWSACWTNTAIVVFTNYSITNIVTGPTNDMMTNMVAVLNPLTNFITIGYHATMVDGDLLQTAASINIFEATARARDVIFNDDMSVIRSFKVDGRSATINSQITFSGFYPPDPVTGYIPPDTPLSSWDSTVSPSLRFLTNNGSLLIANEIHMGDDRPTPFSAIINQGIMTAASISLRSSLLENRGVLSSRGGVFLQGDITKFEDGSSTSAGLTQIAAQNAKFNHYQLTANGPLYLAVTNELSDAGIDSASIFQLQDGFNMLAKPKTGDLLGTSINLVAANVPSVAINNVWAGEDRGPSAAGYVNNAAVGILSFSSQSPSPRFRFLPAGARNALYVDVLDLSLVTDFTNQVSIFPGMTIYFAAAKLGFTPPPDTNNVPQLPEEFLDGQFGGRLRWVQTFTGPNSSEAVVYNGQSYMVNAALRNSLRIDSNGNGIANGNEAEPFAIAPLSVQVNGTGSVQPDYSGVGLVVGQTYTIVATPGAGSEFTGWTGSMTSDEPALTFVMQSNLTFTAHFTYSPVAASYQGLFYGDEGVVFLQSGGFAAKTTSKGTYSARLQIAKNRYSIKGEIGDDGMDTQTVTQSGGSPLTVSLNFGDDQITGTVSSSGWNASLVADRVEAGMARVGSYSFVVPSGINLTNTATPQGDGFGSLKLSSKGSAKVLGSLADGAKFSIKSGLSVEDTLPLYAPLYSSGGQLLGWLNFEDLPDEDFSGLVSWIKTPDAAAKYYPAGLDVETTMTGSFFDRNLKPATGFADGYVSLAGGDLTSGVFTAVGVDESGRISDLGNTRLKLKLNSQGLFSGAVRNPDGGKSIRFRGALLQKQAAGSGYFLGTDESGHVILSK